MSPQSRYAIAPQMEDYDQVGQKQEWVPYLMSFCQPDCVFTSVTTNNLGFRNTLDSQGENVVTYPLNSDRAANRSCSVILGGSTVFGVGATHDRHTIPSILNRITDEVWLNFGGRAFNSTQEMILFLLNMPRSTNRILLFSGVNNIILAFLNNGSSPLYGAFFGQSVFESAMKSPTIEYIGVRRAARQLFKELRHRFLTSSASDLSVCGLGDDYQNILCCFQRDLRVLKVLADGLGIPIYFALQPVATWIDKKLSPEEKKIFDILDNIQAAAWQVLSESISTVRDCYFADVARICVEEKVHFYNLNLDPAFRDDAWLFVDRVHLTDRGHALSAEIVKREFLL